MSRRGATDLSGVLLVDKPAGMTSHDVVSVVRKATGERRVGHAGTLDPAATGLLVMLVGPAARLGPYLTAVHKTYRATIVFGVSTDTDDADGTPTATAPVPIDLLDESYARETIAGLVGVHDQVPPAYSAIKVEGRVAHKAARNGEALDIASRSVEVLRSALVRIGTDPVTWEVEFEVSKGTYIRALARDLGLALGTVAHLGGLVRTTSGSLSLESAHTLEQVRDTDVRELFAPALDALGLPVLEVDEQTVALVSDGRPLDPGHPLQDGRVAVAHEGRLLAIYAFKHGALRPDAVFPGGVA